MSQTFYIGDRFARWGADDEKVVENDYSVVLKASTTVRKIPNDFKGVLYYTQPRFKLVTVDTIGDYHFCTSKFNKKTLVMSANSTLGQELKKIANKCHEQAVKLHPDVKMTVFDDETLFLKVSKHLLFDDIPSHRRLKVCVDVYGYCVDGLRGFLQCEVSEWKLEPMFN